VDDKLIVVGRVAGLYGIKGWVKVFSYTDPMEAVVDYSPWFIRARDQKNAGRKTWVQVKLKAGKRHAKTVVAKLDGCNDRNAAMAYVGTEIAIEPQQLESLKEKNEYYWRELIGLRVINQQDVELGVVKKLLETGANDVLVVVSDIESVMKSEAEPEEASESENVKPEIRERPRERLIPWTMNNAIIAVDLERQVIEVDWDPEF